MVQSTELRFPLRNVRHRCYNNVCAIEGDTRYTVVMRVVAGLAWNTSG